MEMKCNVSDILAMEIYGDSELRFIEEESSWMGRFSDWELP